MGCLFVHCAYFCNVGVSIWQSGHHVAKNSSSVECPVWPIEIFRVVGSPDLLGKSVGSVNARSTAEEGPSELGRYSSCRAGAN